MDPNVCREHFDKLLGEEASALARLESLLDREHELLVANDVDELELAGEARQNCVGELIRIEDERRTLCRMHSVPADLEGLERLMNWCDPSRALQARWAQCSQHATACRAANDRNGALVAARMKKVEGMLDVLTGRANTPKIYGKQGEYASVERSSRLTVSV